MSLVRQIARPLLGACFMQGGLGAAKSPASRAVTADSVIKFLVTPIRPDLSPEQVVRANGVLQVVAGGALAMGIAPKVAASLLIGSMIPTTIAGHHFWTHDGQERSSHRTQFWKNAGIVGGLALVAAGD